MVFLLLSGGSDKLLKMFMTELSVVTDSPLQLHGGSSVKNIFLKLNFLPFLFVAMETGEKNRFNADQLFQHQQLHP